LGLPSLQPAMKEHVKMTNIANNNVLIRSRDFLFDFFMFVSFQFRILQHVKVIKSILLHVLSVETLDNFKSREHQNPPPDYL
jgi:hypothetical protein